MMHMYTSTPSRRIVVGIADAKICSDPSQEVVTYALGSCVGVVLYDPVVKVMGMLHAMLPQAASAPLHARNTPTMFVDAGLPWLLDTCLRAGARVSRLVITAAGGRSSPEVCQVKTHSASGSATSPSCETHSAGLVFACRTVTSEATVPAR